MPSQLSKPSSLYVHVGIVLVLALIQPFLWGYVKRAAAQLNSNQTNEEYLATLSQTVRESQQAFTVGESRFAELQESFPSATSISQVVGRIEAIADELHLVSELKSIEDDTPVEVGSSRIAVKHILVDVTGPIDALLLFLERMEYQKEFTTIESFDINSSSQSQFTMSVRALYYFYDE